MKFRGKIEDINLLFSMIRLVNVFAKQHREIVVRIDRQNMFFICKELKEGVQMYARLPVCYMFTEYLFEGVSNEYDQIFILLESDKFLRTLKQANQQTKSLKLKLTRKGYSSFIEITCEQQSHLGSDLLNINHDVPIELLSRKDWDFYNELSIEENENVFYLPPLKHIRNVIDKQKNFEKYLTIILQNFSLTVKTKNLLCEISTFYPNIEFKEPNNYNPDPDDPDRKEIEVDGRRLSTFLNSLNLNSTIKIEVNLVEKQLINFSFIQDHIYVKFTIPHQFASN